MVRGARSSVGGAASRRCRCVFYALFPPACEASGGEEDDDDEEAAAGPSGGQGGDSERRLKDELDQVNHLTALPHPDDILLHAVPVLGPYSSMHNWRYKVKITPGSMKSGRAARTAFEIFARAAETPQREKDILRQVPDALLSSTMVGNVKLSMPGLTQKISAVKSAKRQAAKERNGAKG